MQKEYTCAIPWESASKEELKRMGGIVKWFRGKEPKDVVNVFTRGQLWMFAVYVTGEEIDPKESMANLSKITIGVCNRLSDEQAEKCLAEDE